MANIEVRLAKLEEIDAVVKIAVPMWTMHGARENTLLNEKYLGDYDAKSYFEECIKKPTQNALYVAVDGQEVVGCVRAEVMELEGMFHQKKAVYIDDLAVKDTHRKMGIASMLLAESETFARNQGIKLLKTKVYDFNTPAKQTFSKQDFRSVYSELYKTLD